MRKAIIRRSKKHVLVLCNLGHLLDSHKADETYGGSSFEAEISFRHDGDRFDRLASKCKGAGH